MITSFHTLATHLEQLIRIDQIMYVTPQQQQQQHMIIPLQSGKRHDKHHIIHTSRQAQAQDTDSDDSASDVESDVELDTT